jgi:hypothetical protein
MNCALHDGRRRQSRMFCYVVIDEDNFMDLQRLFASTQLQ